MMRFVIDSFMRLGIDRDNYSEQADAIFEIADWTVCHDVHVHLVTHSHKSFNGSAGLEPEDVRGAAELSDNAFNIFGISWDRDCDNRIRELELNHADPQRLEELKARPGVFVDCSKQRNGDWVGRLGLWFDPDSYRYRSGIDPGDWQYVESVPVNDDPHEAA